MRYHIEYWDVKGHAWLTSEDITRRQITHRDYAGVMEWLRSFADGRELVEAYIMPLCPCSRTIIITIKTDLESSRRELMVGHYGVMPQLLRTWDGNQEVR